MEGWKVGRLKGCNCYLANSKSRYLINCNPEKPDGVRDKTNSRDASASKKVLEDFESEEKRLSGIGAQEESEVQKLLESAVRLRINYSKLVQQ